MPRFLNATQARREIESILTKARQNIFMISPYIKVNDDLISRLTDAGARRKVKILLVCRENDLRDEQRKRVEQVPNLELRFNEKVHAKCYFNEDSMVTETDVANHPRYNVCRMWMCVSSVAIS